MAFPQCTESVDSARKEAAVLVRFHPAWAYLKGIREFGRFFCATTAHEPQAADRVEVMIQETLENAVKYSDQDTLADLELVMDTGNRKLQVSVSSYPSPEHLDTLKHELEQLCSQDPEQAYLAAFERASRDPDASARLGLARLRFECQAELSLSEDEGGRIRVTARTAL